MRILWAHLCDLAFLSQDGKPNLIGIFDQIRGPALPLRLDRATIAVTLEVLAGDPTSFPVRLRLVDEDGTPTWEHTLNVGIQLAPGMRKATPTLFVNLNHVDLQTTGTWEFEVAIGEERHAIALEAQLLPAAPETPPSA